MVRYTSNPVTVIPSTGFADSQLLRVYNGVASNLLLRPTLDKQLSVRNVIECRNFRTIIGEQNCRQTFGRVISTKSLSRSCQTNVI